ncbi:MAG: pantetheine-phosphate adenylyltransferase [Rickettsiales bacterium]|nr:pantetheine-phosphate adenylyltransferase [Rickettsiales bacterium]
MEKIGIYPGTFDPITAGHMDIILRASKVLDKLYIGVAMDSMKSPLFSQEERLEMIQQELSDNNIKKGLVEVEAFSGLLVNFAKQRSASIIIRGLRAVSDFEFEFQMSCMNSILDSEMQTIFLPASADLQLVSSKFVKEVTRLGGDTGGFISDRVKRILVDKYK